MDLYVNFKGNICDITVKSTDHDNLKLDIAKELKIDPVMFKISQPEDTRQLMSDDTVIIAPSSHAKLVEMGVEVDMNSFSSCDDVEIFKLFLDVGFKPDDYNIVQVIDNDNWEIIKFLLDQGANIEKQNRVGMTLLNHAAYLGQFELVKFLLERGADVNTWDSDIDTPLHNAVDQGRVEIVEILLEYNPDLNIQNNDGWTPLVIAAKKNDDVLTRILLDA